ncbi:MAG: ABC transporter substrate-binding protein [Coprobacillaceae bacterium]
MKKLFGILSIFMIGLVGCSSTPAEASTDEPLVLWGGFSGGEETAINLVIDEYNNTNGDARDVVYESQEDINTKLLTAMSTGQGPDIVIWDRVNTITYAKQDAFVGLDDYISASDMDTSVYYQEAFDEMNIDGVQYGIPMTVDTRVLFYNKDLFDAAGLDYPTNEWTWDDMYNAATACSQTADGKLSVAGMDLSDAGLFSQWIYQAGGEMADEEAMTMSFNSEQGKAVLNEWQKYLDSEAYKNGYIGGENGIQDAFASNKVCMKFDGPWALTSLSEQGTNFGTITAPEGPGSMKSTIIGGFGFAVPTTTDDEQGAFDFINWWTNSQEAADIFFENAGHLPANTETIESEAIQSNENVGTITEQLDYAVARPQISGYGDAEYFGLKANLDKFMAGELTVEETLEQGEADANQMLSEANK